MKKIYLGNLSLKTKESQVEKLFADLGTIASLTMMRDRKSKRFKGSCFVEMEDDEAALAAIEALNGKDIDGRVLVANEVEAPEKASGWRAGVNSDKGDAGGKNRKRAGKRKASEGAGTTRGGSTRGTLGNRGGGGDRG